MSVPVGGAGSGPVDDEGATSVHLSQVSAAACKFTVLSYRALIYLPN